MSHGFRDSQDLSVTVVASVVYIAFITWMAILSVFNSLVKVVNGAFASSVALE